ncbi:MAG TPA: hypothetical protein VFO41_15910, partial [Alphaproteobacteria bacterium]|nr:hypothetical protein [Alphaproteobacteria bacterium]
MSLMGEAAVLIWNGIRPSAQRDFIGWHNREHLLERVKIPGFVRGRRYAALEGHPRFFTLYEVDRVENLRGRDYRDRLDSPTPWTTRVVSQFEDTERALMRVLVSKGLGGGGIVATLRFELEEPRVPLMIDWFSTAAEEVFARNWDIVGLHLGRSDLAASGTDTAERRLRPGQ